MKTIIWFTSGFLIPTLMTIYLLMHSYVSNDWSGNSPLNYMYWIPLFYLTSLSICVSYFVISRRHPKNSKFIFLAGIVGGLSLMLLPNETASIISGVEIPTMLIVGVCMTTVLWLSARTPD